MATGVRLPEQNQVMITGRLTRDPEIFVTPGGVSKCWFSVAVNQRYKDKTSGEWKDQTSFVPIIVWRDAASRCKEKLKKGSPVHIEGRLRSREYEDKKSGSKRTVLEVEARRVQFLAQSDDRSDVPAQAEVPEAAAGGSDIEEVPF